MAAAELCAQGFDVSLFEAGRTLGGMYEKVQTPFGKQELGMHVLYLTKQHYDHLSDIFGEQNFTTWDGPAVDIASTRNFGKNFFNSVYPDLRDHPLISVFRNEILDSAHIQSEPSNGLDALIVRFGKSAGTKVFAPILEKLWKINPEKLSPDAIHCFYDLRRVVLWDKAESDQIKADPLFDSVIGNPDQKNPMSSVYGGRMAARFNSTAGSLESKVANWVERTGIKVVLNTSAELHDGVLRISGEEVQKDFQGCIVASPLHALDSTLRSSMNFVELSIFYFRVESNLVDQFPAYYMLVHERKMISSRIVNYSAYSSENRGGEHTVISVEVVHPMGQRPEADVVAGELGVIFPDIVALDSFRMNASLKLPAPTLHNANLLDRASAFAESCYEPGALYFAGMRTDKGTFFSHQTIGLAYDSALDCARRLASN